MSRGRFLCPDRRRPALLTFFLVVLTSTTWAATRPPTIDELIGLQSPAAPVISPDGRFVAYTLRQPNWTDNKYETQVWLTNTQSASLIQPGRPMDVGLGSFPIGTAPCRSMSFRRSVVKLEKSPIRPRVSCNLAGRRMPSELRLRCPIRTVKK